MDILEDKIFYEDESPDKFYLFIAAFLNADCL